MNILANKKVLHYNAFHFFAVQVKKIVFIICEHIKGEYEDYI